MISVQLTPEQRTELKQICCQASSKDSEKALMVLMSADGRNVKEISAALKRNPHTVRDWLKRYQKEGAVGLSRKYSPGRPKEKRDKVKERIEKVIPNPPSLYGYMDNVWTVPLIVYDINKSLNISVSVDTVIRALKDLGYSYKRPAKTVPSTEPSPKSGKKFVQLKNLTMTSGK
mmetsp:Transcript_22036/g.10413  ORF Transcript_22036/g.10413 Transcript_22036/m.10413 type:complete len:174 (-) Transcript_22036:98-619(-)